MTNNELIDAVSRKKNIPQDLRQILAKGYDWVFVALGTKYLIAAQDALTSMPEETTAFAFASKGSKEFIGDCIGFLQPDTSGVSSGRRGLNYEAEKYSG